MNCEEINLIIEEYYEGLLETDLKNRFEKHLTNCLSCQMALTQFQELRNLLKKSVIPSPSANLSQGLMKAFQAQHQQSSVWWKKIFTGSVSISKPVLAGVLLLMAMAIIGANLLGKNSNNSQDLLKSSNPVSPNLQSEQTKIVEVPIIKYVEVPVVKNNVVERIIYVNKEVKRKPNQQINSKSIKEIPNKSLLKNNDFIQTSLKGFQPLSEIKTKIIKEEKLTYEK